MKKIKFVLMGLVALLFVVVGVWLGVVKRPEKSYPQKAADILPTLPVPKAASAALGHLMVGTNAATVQVVFVPRVIDGDTIVVEPVDSATGKPGKQETIRYIGMDTPETVSPTKPVECYGHEASARNKALVDGQYVAIMADKGNKDKYGRLLRYVYLLGDPSSSGMAVLGAFVNLELVKEGYARVLTIPPNTEFADEFSSAADAAQSAKLGFWGACAEYPFQ